MREAGSLHFPPMRAVKSQYFLTYAALGALVPFMPIYLTAEGLNKRQVGDVLAAGNMAIVLSPVIVTLLADARMEGRRLMALLGGICAISLAFLLQVHWFWAILVIWLLQCLALRPALPLQDGINFTLQQQRKARGLNEEPYHTVRVWGTLGYMLPSFALFVLYRFWPGKVWICIACGIALAIMGLLNALWLPRVPAPPREKAASRVPTLDAGRRMLQKPLFVYCLAMLLLNTAAQGFYVGYPMYLTEKLHINLKWVGLISNLGVCVEFFFLMIFGFLQRWLGLKTMTLVGAGGMIARMALLAAFPTPWVAIGTQLLHGLMTTAIVISPPIFMNRHADDRYRNSMQGMYTMAVAGVGQVTGSWLAGWIARTSFERVFWWSAGLCAAAGVLIAIAFTEEGAIAEPGGYAGSACLNVPERS